MKNIDRGKKEKFHFNEKRLKICAFIFKTKAKFKIYTYKDFLFIRL